MIPVLARSVGYLLFAGVVVTALVLLGALVEQAVHSCRSWLRGGR